MKDEAINKILKKLVRKAKVKIPQNKRFTFHSLRKRFLSTAYSLGIDSEHAKLMVGKSIGTSIETYIQDASFKDSFIKAREENLSLSNGTIKSEMETKDVEIAKLNQEVKALRTVLFGLGINREQVEKLVAKQLEKEKVVITGDVGTIPISRYVKNMSDEKLFQEFQRIQNKKQQEEYQKLLDETNGFNHK